MISSTKWICAKCPSNKGKDCGPWEENSNLFSNCEKIHKNHRGWKVATENDIQSLRGINPFQPQIDLVLQAASKDEERVNYKIKTQVKPIDHIEKYNDTIIANDSKLSRKILRVGLSAYSNDPINLSILAPYSEGKSYTAVKVLDQFPKEDVIFIGGMSPTALVHERGTLVDSNNEPIEEKIIELNMKLDATLDKNAKEEIRREIRDISKGSKKLIDLTGKILLFLDSPNIELWDRLKPILSHDKREIEFRITQGKNNSHTTSHIIIKGWPACIFCSAKNEKHSPLWGEIESRFVTAIPNMNRQKYKKANKLTGMKKGLPSFARSLIYSEDAEKLAKYYIVELRDKIKKLSDKGNSIWNPFHPVISEEFPNSEGVTMRSYNRFTSFCNIETLINSDYDHKIVFETKEGKQEENIITSLSDISRTIDVIGLDTAIPEDKISFVTDVMEPLLNVQFDDLTSDKMAKRYTEVYNKPTTPKKVLETFLYPLFDYGIIDFKVNPEDHRQKIWRLLSSPNAKTFDFIETKIIEHSKNNDLFVWSGIDELEKCSINLGRIKKIIDPDGIPTGYNLIQKEITGIEPKGSSNNFMEAYS